MPHLFLEYKPLIEDELEFIHFWNEVRKNALNEGLIKGASLFKIREDLFLAQIEFEHPDKDAIYRQFAENKGVGGHDMSSVCKVIRVKYNATHKGNL